VFANLTAVPSKDKQFYRRPQSMNRTGKTAGFTDQTRQVMAQFGIIGFNRVGLALIGQGLVLAGIINERIIGRKLVRILVECLRGSI
jgi:hypothetical protein